MEFTKDCRVICGFDFSLVKCFTACCFPFVGEYREIDIDLFWNLIKWGEGRLEGRFMVNKCRKQRVYQQDL